MNKNHYSGVFLNGIDASCEISLLRESFSLQSIVSQEDFNIVEKLLFELNQISMSNFNEEETQKRSAIFKALSLIRYRNRRNRLRRHLSSPAIIYGMNEPPGGQNIWPYIASPIYQEPLMLYLTGINQLHCALWLSDENSQSDRLFLPPHDSLFEFWQGRRLGIAKDEHVKNTIEITGIQKIEPLKELNQFCEGYFKTKANFREKSLHLLWHEKIKSKKNQKIIKDSNEIQNRILRAFLSKKKHKIKYRNIHDLQLQERLPLDKIDIYNAQKANDLTGIAFERVLPQIHRCQYEYEVSGMLDGELLSRTPYGKAFPTIAASGENANILHYEKYDDVINKGELFLLDFGLRWYSMHADISRTFPVNGQFNPLQKMLYTICLNAQAEVEKYAKAGISIAKIDKICWEYIENQLKKQFLSRGGKMKRSYTFKPHGVSHLMGEIEHDGDINGHYQSKPMKEGWMISNEPGIYGEFEITLDGVRYCEALGIRIEDNLIIQKDGNINLSKNIPKQIADIEKLMKLNNSVNF